MGLILTVYRAADGRDCTNGGISSKHERVTVVNVPGPFEPTDEAPGVLLLDDRPMGKPYPRLVPVDFKPGYDWVMFGGNYAGTSDSRFQRALREAGGGDYGIAPIHDRREG